MVIIIALLIAFLLFSLTLGICFPMQIYDGTDDTSISIVEQGVSLEVAAYHHIVEGLQNEKYGVIEVHLDEYDVNEMLYAISRDMDLGAVKLRSMYIESSDRGYMLFVPIRLFGIDSVISGGLKLYDSDGIIHIEIENVRLGRLKIDSGILSLLNIKELITESMSKYYISSYFEGETLKANISREDLGGLISKLNEDSENRGLIDALYGVLMLDTDAVSIDINSPIDCKITVDLSVFSGVRDDQFQSVNSFSSELLNEGIIDADKVGLIAEYYINGYERLADDEKQTVTELLLERMGEDNLKNYAGAVSREKVSLTDILLDQLKINPDSLAPGFKISDKNINAMLTSTPFIATVWQYSSYRTNECAYIMLQSVYCHIGEDRVDLYIDLNINGYLLTVSANFICEDSRSIAISGTLDKLALGGHRLSEKNTKSLFDFLCSIMQQEWIYTNEETMSLTLDFTNAFNDNGLLSAILGASKNTVTVCKRNLITDGGYINIIFSLF